MWTRRGRHDADGWLSQWGGGGPRHTVEALTQIPACWRLLRHWDSGGSLFHCHLLLLADFQGSLLLPCLFGKKSSPLKLWLFWHPVGDHPPWLSLEVDQGCIRPPPPRSELSEPVGNGGGQYHLCCKEAQIYPQRQKPHICLSKPQRPGGGSQPGPHLVRSFSQRISPPFGSTPPT